MFPTSLKDTKTQQKQTAKHIKYNNAGQRADIMKGISRAE